jgi:hypothetical protein
MRWKINDLGSILRGKTAVIEGNGTETIKRIKHLIDGAAVSVDRGFSCIGCNLLMLLGCLCERFDTPPEKPRFV